MSMADAAFQERLARISRGEGHVAAGLLAPGQLDKIRKDQAKAGKPVPTATLGVQEKKTFPVKRVAVAFFLGALSFAGGSLGAFHATNSVPSEFDQWRPLVEALGPVGMSGLLAMFLLYVSGFRSVWLVGVMGLGFYAAYMAEPHGAKAAPELWTMAYSANHADALKFRAISETAMIRAQLGLDPALPPELAPE